MEASAKSGGPSVNLQQPQAIMAKSYVPERRDGQPRSIHSNQDNQRILAHSTNSSGSNGNLQMLDKQQINDRLSLLKSNFKSKTQVDSQHEQTPSMTIFTHPDEPGRNVSVRDD